MKKIFKIILILIPALSLLIACGGGNKGNNDTSSASQSAGNTQSVKNIDFTAIFEGKSNIKLTGLSESEKQAIIDAGKAAGVNVLFSNYENAVFFTRLSDGYNAAWTLDGWDVWSKADIKPAEWTDNEFTKQIPKPEFKLFMANVVNEEFTAVFKDVTLEHIKDYTESVKTAGFTVNSELDEKSSYTYIYTAANSKGYSISVKRYSDDQQTVYIEIKKK